ncbi:MAG: SDR family oxidoreductase [Candidatus Rokubacteria bacterium]|nr:SDR family oxidoreductase [Candidatus Rokubacteria bacterium]MBI3105386.1 SDR family oxidoreductase [Candidatus Rokubacteria bacterium]
MEGSGSVVVVGGTAGLGKEVARHYAGRGRDVVISGRDRARAAAVAGEIGGRTRGLGLDLAEPKAIAGSLAEVGPVGQLVITAIERDQNTVRDYDVGRAVRLATLKLVGYTEVVHALASRLEKDSAIVLFGGLAKERPYPGSTTVSTVNGGVSALVRTLAIELAPIRVNALHPGIVGDSPYWADKTEALERVRARTPTGRLATMRDIVGATVFLLENPAMNGVDLNVDGGWVVL